jgi:hypothetical protein
VNGSGQLDMSFADPHIHLQRFVKGDLMIWDNRALIHRSLHNTQPEPSLSYRITVNDAEPFYPGIAGMTTGTVLETYAVDEAILAGVLQPYRENCHYQRDVEVQKSPGVAQARFAIGESCYIADTGHFNAVECNVCYNELGYYLLAICIDRRLFPSLEPWTLADFWQRQLSDVLIYSFSSRSGA